MLTNKQRFILNNEISKVGVRSCKQQIGKFYFGLKSDKGYALNYKKMMTYLSSFGSRYTLKKDLLPGEMELTMLASNKGISPRIQHIDKNVIVWDKLQPITDLDVLKLYDLLVKSVRVGLHHMDPGGMKKGLNVMQDDNDKYYLIDWGEAERTETKNEYLDAAILLTDYWKRVLRPDQKRNLISNLRTYVSTKYKENLPQLPIEKRELLKAQLRLEQERRIEEYIAKMRSKKSKF